jgi:hypothetical protein
MNRKVQLLVITCFLMPLVSVYQTFASDSLKGKGSSEIKQESSDEQSSGVLHPNITLKRGNLEQPAGDKNLKISGSGADDKHPCPGLVPPQCKYFNDDDGD